MLFIILYLNKKSFSGVSVSGDFDVINFSDVTESDQDKTATFQFEFDPMAPDLNIFLGYTLRLTWSQVSGPGSGVIKSSRCRLGRRSTGQVQLERVRHTRTYRLYVPLYLIGEGQLLVNMSINISCSVYVSSYWISRYLCRCKEWQIRGMSNSLQISAKRG